jgi:8-amino-3,8-dideoxy-alpha-D-manno-octulosonate transaminase
MSGPGSFWIGKEETEEVLEVLKSGYLSRYGDPSNPKFKKKAHTLETEFAEYCGVPHALAVSSGTSALWIALQAMGIGPGDEVLVPAYTFVATYSAVFFCGAVPVLCEIDESLTMDPSDIEARITPKTKAIMPVHMLGNPSKMDAIMKIARKHKLLVLEDCCQANGASYRGRRVGSFGDMGGYSLNIFKTITAGDGGLLVAKAPEHFKRAFALHDQGHSPMRMGVEIGQRTILGMNFRINELTGAVALAQLRKLDRITSTLRAKKNKLKKALGELPGVRYRELNDAEGECGTLLTLIFDSPRLAEKVSRELGSKTIDQSGWHVYFNMEHVLKKLGELGRPTSKGSLPRTDDILSRALNISVGVVDAGLGAGFGINIDSTDAEIEKVAGKIRKAVAAQSRAIPA